MASNDANASTADGATGTELALRSATAEARAISTRQHRYVVDAMDRWSRAFFRPMLPWQLGSNSTIARCVDEGAKKLSIGLYIGRRVSMVDSIPYDGSRYEGREARDESKGLRSLWHLKSTIPDGFTERQDADICVPLGHVFNCHRCRGHGFVRCLSCHGSGGQYKRDSDGRQYWDSCGCGNGQRHCDSCDGYGLQLKVLRVMTAWVLIEKKGNEYAGRLPKERLAFSAGNSLFRRTVEFDQRAVMRAVEECDGAAFDDLMEAVRAELKAEANRHTADPTVDSAALCQLVDDYFDHAPDYTGANDPLDDEDRPIRLRYDVTAIPVTYVTYTYKEKPYSLYVYGTQGSVWVDGTAPESITWKLVGLVMLVVAIVAALIALGNASRTAPIGRAASSSAAPAFTRSVSLVDEAVDLGAYRT